MALNHTAGLSLPQQVMMSMFSLAELMDARRAIRRRAWRSCNRRAMGHDRGSGPELAPNPNYDAYYGLIDFEFWARRTSARKLSST